MQSKLLGYLRDLGIAKRQRDEKAGQENAIFDVKEVFQPFWPATGAFFNMSIDIRFRIGLVAAGRLVAEQRRRLAVDCHGQEGRVTT